MMLLCNRFAFIPHLCLECKRYIWLDGYRRAEVWKDFIDKSIKENICKDCLAKFDVITNQVNAVGNVNPIFPEEMITGGTNDV